MHDLPGETYSGMCIRSNVRNEGLCTPSGTASFLNVPSEMPEFWPVVKTPPEDGGIVEHLISAVGKHLQRKLHFVPRQPTSGRWFLVWHDDWVRVPEMRQRYAFHRFEKRGVVLSAGGRGSSDLIVKV